jgi:uncharacterized membrane protein
MNAKQWVIGTVVGAVVLFATGWVLFEMLLGGYYEANAGSATGVDKDPPILWSVAVGALAYAALIIYAMRGQAASVNMVSGMKVGAVVGFLLWATADFTLFAITNMNNLTITMVDPFVELVHGGITGAVIGALLPKVA